MGNDRRKRREQKGGDNKFSSQHVHGQFGKTVG
jgi:hypothetical protein